MTILKCLVTGGAGFIGSHVVDELIDRGHKVIVLDNLCVGEEKNVNRCAVFINGDIRDETIVEKCMKDVDVVFHFAYDATECKSIFSPVLDTDINLKGSMVVLKEAINAGVEKFVFPSSVLVYGKPKYLPINESHPLVPDDPYSVSKMAFEHYLRVYYELGKIKPYVVRFNNTYGPRLRLDNPYKGVTQIFISRALVGKSPKVFGDGEQTRAFTYIDDMKKPIVDIIEYDELINVPINLGSEFIHSVNDVANIVIENTIPCVEIEHIEKRQKDIKHAYCDVTKMKTILNYECKTTLEDGLKKTIGWARGRVSKFEYNWIIEIPSLLENVYKEKKI